MKTVTLGVASRAASKERLAHALRGDAQGEFISFATVDLLWKVLSAKRWEILQAMAGQGGLSIREVARRVQREVKSVHGDVTSLIDAGVVERTDHGVRFPYDAVRVNFTLKAA
ncbi:MAG TPA: transcriptional regulator [Rhodanobacteraceae bacterium]